MSQKFRASDWLSGIFRYIFFDGCAYLTFRLHILKSFGVFFNILYAYLHLFNTRREITMLDEVLVCMTIRCVCGVAVYPGVQFGYGNAWNKKCFPVVDLWRLLTLRRRIKSHLLFAGIIRSSPFSLR